MKLTDTTSLRKGIWPGLWLAWTLLTLMTHAQGFTTTTVQGTVYLANGQAGSGTLLVSWPAFTTAANQAVAAGRMTETIGSDGFVSMSLAPNQGSTPAGLYYTAIYHLSDGTTSTEYWVVPAAAQAAISQVRAQLMPAAQAVQAVNKTYVDQSIQELTQSLLTASGGSLSGPLYLNGDPIQPTQAANKHYVDSEFKMAVPLSGGVMTGPLTSVQLGAAYQVDQFAGADFGVKLEACLNQLNATYGGTCDARNFTGNLSMGSNLTITTANATVQLPCATISTANQVVVSAGTRNVTLHGCALRGASSASGSQGGTVFLYSGNQAMMQVGDSTYVLDTPGFHIDNVVINTTAASGSTAQAFTAYRTQELDLESLYLLGNSNQTGLTLDGTGNYSGGTFQDIQIGGFGTGVNGIGHQIANSATTDWLNASTFLRLHIDCPTSNGSPVSGTYGINLQQGDGNTFTGGDVEGCSTALHLGPNAQNNTIVGLRNENSTNQVVADAGSSYNNWMTGGTMFTGQLTDNGTRNSFLDTFHRSFNGLNGDWYGSQQDATVTNHYRIGTGAGNERGLLNRYQTDYGYRWTSGFSDATGGEQFYQLLDELNNVYRFSIGQYNNGQSSTNNQTVINAAGTGAVVLNGSSNAGTGGVLFGAGGMTGATVASISNAGNAQFNGSLLVGGPTTFTNSTTVKNQIDGEIDSFLWAGATANQKESYTYKDYVGASQWYLLKDASNNWALNSAIGGLDSLKAYQSTNSGDTYINASNATGHIRLNYETGAGSETDIYSGSSAGLVAAFLGTTAIKFPGLAATSGRYCLQIDNSGYISNTGLGCGGLTGTVNVGTMGQVAYYTGNGSAIAGMTAVSVTAGGTGASSAAQALQNLGGQQAVPGLTPDGASGVAVQGNVAAATTVSSVNNVVNVMAPPYSAACNLTQYAQGSMAASSAILTGSGFTSALVGQETVVWNAGAVQPNGSHAPLVTTVASYQSPTQVTLAAQAKSAVSAAPFEIGTLDTTAFQNAVNAAVAIYASVLVPANKGKSCLVGTIDTSAGNTASDPVMIRGQGSYVSSITGLPGQDVLQWPDGRKVCSGYSALSGLHIYVDASLDVSSGPGGAGTYPNRVTGMAANGSGGLTAVSPAISPGPVSFSAGAISQSGDGTYDELTVSNTNGGWFDQLPSWNLVGMPVVIPGLGINATITAVLSRTQLTFTPAYTGTASSLAGTYGTGIAPPWYVGNAGFVVPASNGANSGGVQMMFDDLSFTSLPSSPAFANHSAGMLFQQPPYFARFNRITMQNLYYGYIEALPTSGNQITWTPDTSTYHDININTLIPMVQYAGNHRILDGISIYGANHPLALGPFFLNAALNNAGGSTVTHFYHECWSNNSGENQRWSGSQWTISAASLTQCQGPYVKWTAASSTITNVQIGGPYSSTQATAGLQLTGNSNTFDGMTFTTGGTVEPLGSGGNDQVNDSGIDNYVINAWNGSGRRFAENYARFPTGINDGAYLMGNSQTPYMSLADLHTTCADWTIIPHSPATGWCVQDTGAATNGNTAGNYFYAPSSTSGYIQFIFNGTPMAVGYRLPSGSVYLMLAGYSSSAVSQQFKVYESNGNALVGTCTFAMTTSLYLHGGPNSSDPCPINLSSIATGDPLYIQFSPSATASLNVQWIDFKPQWSDPLVGPSLSVTGNTAAATVTATTSVTAPVVNASTSTGLQVGGSQVTTGNLGDWTNAGVANGYLPTWSAATGKWTPGAPPATSTGGLTDWTNAGIASGYVPAWNAGTGKWSPTAPATTVYPQQVASIASATYSGTTTLAPTTLYAVPSGKAGQYRLCTNYSVTAVGTAGTAVAAIRYTTDGQAVGYGGIGAPVNTTLRTLTSFPINCYEFYADASSSIMWELQLTGVTGSPTFRYGASLEYMGP